MTRLFFILVSIVFIGLGIFWLSTLQGFVTIDVFEREIRMPLILAILFMLFVVSFFILIWAGLVKLWRLPGEMKTLRKTKRVRTANTALAEGLLAAEAGDTVLADKLSRKAETHADDERLKVLLQARQAEARRDWIKAERAWAHLSELPGGELAGLRGAAAAALQRGDTELAELSARQALALNSGAEWPFHSLFDLQVARGDWTKALETLKLGEKQALLDKRVHQRRQAVLLTALATALPYTDQGEAQKTLAEALKLAPGFAPAAWHLARLYLKTDQKKSAISVLETCWPYRPHPALALLISQYDHETDPTALGVHLEALVKANPDHYESRLLTAKLAMLKEDWMRAVNLLSELAEENMTGRLCLLMEKALQGYGDEPAAAHWARLAVSASREADWSDIDPKGQAFDYSPEEWTQLVYKFGDGGQLVHPRYEAFKEELDESTAYLHLPAPDKGTKSIPSPAKLAGQSSVPPLDYVSGSSDDQS